MQNSTITASDCQAQKAVSLRRIINRCLKMQREFRFPTNDHESAVFDLLNDTPASARNRMKLSDFRKRLTQHYAEALADGFPLSDGDRHLIELADLDEAEIFRQSAIV